MMRTLYTILVFSFICSSAFSQNVQEIRIFTPSEETKDFRLSSKVVYEYDENETTRVESFKESRLNPENGQWENYNKMVKDYNDHKHLINYQFARWEEGEWSYYTKRNFNIKYSDGEVESVTMDDYSDTSNKNKINQKVNVSSTLYSDYVPLKIRNAPDYIIEVGENMILDENGNLLSAILEKCNHFEFQFSYYPNGLVAEYEKLARNDFGDYYVIEKGTFIYEGDVDYTDEFISTAQNISVYPNPSRDYINIAIDQTLASQQLMIVNAYGKLIKEVNFPLDVKEIQVDISDLSSGIYYLTSDTASFSKGQKIIKID